MSNDAYEAGYNLGRKLGEEAPSPFLPFSDDDISWRLGMAAAFLKVVARREPPTTHSEGDPVFGTKGR